MEKSLIRKEIKERLSLLSDGEKETFSNEIFKKVLLLDEYKKAKTIFCFMSDFNEPQTVLFIKKAIRQGKTVYVPRINGDNMDAIEIDIDTEFWFNKFKILEPKKRDDEKVGKNFDFTITPLMAYDSELNRLGRGKGYYDRFFEKHKTFKCGVAFFCQKVDKINMEKNDIKLDMVVTNESN